MEQSMRQEIRQDKDQTPQTKRSEELQAREQARQPSAVLQPAQLLKQQGISALWQLEPAQLEQIAQQLGNANLLELLSGGDGEGPALRPFNLPTGEEQPDKTNPIHTAEPELRPMPVLGEAKPLTAQAPRFREWPVFGHDKTAQPSKQLTGPEAGVQSFL